MTDPSSTVINAPGSPPDRRYPRPPWFRILRKLLIWWWLLPALCLALYILGLALNVSPANYFHTLLDHLHFLTQSWWTILLSVIILIGIGVLLFASYRWADDDYWNELREQQLREQQLREQREFREQQHLPPPPGFKLRSTLRGYEGAIWQIAWAPGGRTLASGSNDKTIRLWDVQAAQVLHTLTGHTDKVYSVAWAPDGRTLASGSADKTIRLWDVETAQVLHTLTGHTGMVYSVAWAPDGRTLASGSLDETIRLWDVETEREVGILESHTGNIRYLAFSFDGRLLASKSDDNTIRLWRTDTWEVIAKLQNYSTLIYGLAFSPKFANILVTRGEQDTAIHIWELDLTILLGSPSDTPSVRYTNAKVVLVGDSGVGKSGLGLVLTGQPFAATDSTHGRYVWTFDNQEVELDDGREELRETLLWDLAGQPGYRLVHQLHLNEVAVALIIFDGRSEIDPFAGVYHWDRALRQA